MLSDEVRMQAYYDSVFKNASAFAGKVVLDVGTGTGILAIWAAQAGAKKVYAVEATDMAQKAQKLVNANKVQDKVVVLQGKIEDVSLPEQVDIIISEWMGLFLLRESMLDSVLFARDKWMRPGGSLWPSHARMYVAAVQRGQEGRNKQQDYKNAMQDWARFAPNTQHKYGVDMSCLESDFEKEHADYYLASSVWCELSPADLLSQPVLIKEINCNTCTLDDFKTVKSQFTSKIVNHRRNPPKKSPQGQPQQGGGESKLTGFAGWFEVDFMGSKQTPAPAKVTLSTAPHIGYTHWGQQCFFLHPPVDLHDADTVEGTINIVRRKDNQRLMNVEIAHALKKNGVKLKAPGSEQNNLYHME
uniref:type I protein arginine methyltransferase n=1 Tax=Arcella intermedia TaxID=1963864 RepID=A0A6B2L7G5_9EUKA